MNEKILEYCRKNDVSEEEYLNFIWDMDAEWEDSPMHDKMMDRLMNDEDYAYNLFVSRYERLTKYIEDCIAMIKLKNEQ